MLYQWRQNKRMSAATREAEQGSVARILPWLGLLDDGIVITKNMVLMRIIRFKGKDYLVTHASEVEHELSRLNHLLVQMGDGWGWQVDLVREESPAPRMATSPYLASQLIMSERERLYTRYPHFETNSYLTIYYALTPTKKLRTEQFLRSGNQQGHE